MEDKIYEIYQKLKDNGFYCVCGYYEITPKTIKLSNITQFEVAQPFDEIVLRFEHFNENYDLGLYFYGKLYKFYTIITPEDFDNVMTSIITVLRERKFDKYADLLS